MEGKLISLCILTLLIVPAIIVNATENETKERDLLEIQNSTYTNELGEYKTINNNIKILIEEAPVSPTITGPNTINLYTTYTYSISSTDLQNDNVCYEIRFSDTPAIYSTDLYKSGESVSFHHTWSTYYKKSGPYYIYAKSIDSNGHESNWIEYKIDIPETENKYTIYLESILERLINNYPILEVLFDFKFFY
jgi:hypothetical protein